MTSARWTFVAAAAPVALLISGCSDAASSPAVGIAKRFVAAVAQHDGATACALLTPQAAQSAGGAAGTACDKAVVELDEKGSNVSRTEVWNDAAMIRIGSDTVFLRRLSNGWRVSAAGCKYRVKAPYDCDLEA